MLTTDASTKDPKSKVGYLLQPKATMMKITCDEKRLQLIPRINSSTSVLKYINQSLYLSLASLLRSLNPSSLNLSSGKILD